jgi:hypothetical protein
MTAQKKKKFPLAAILIPAGALVLVVTLIIALGGNSNNTHNSRQQSGDLSASRLNEDDPDTTPKEWEETILFDDGSWHVHTYGVDGYGSLNVVNEFNANGELTRHYADLLDDYGNYLGWIEILYYDDGSQMVSEYVYGGDRTHKVIVYDPDGLVIWWYETYRNPDGSDATKVEYEYDGKGNRIKSTTYNHDGTIIDWAEYEYDANGNLVKQTVYNPDGSISDTYDY